MTTRHSHAILLLKCVSNFHTFWVEMDILDVSNWVSTFAPEWNHDLISSSISQEERALFNPLPMCISAKNMRWISRPYNLKLIPFSLLAWPSDLNFSNNNQKNFHDAWIFFNFMQESRCTSYEVKIWMISLFSHMNK